MESSVTITCKIEHETDKAVLVNHADQKTWLPKSQIELDRESDGTAVVLVPGWLATERGLI